MTESFRFDAGIGDRNSPIESEQYARRWRIDLQAAVEHLSIYPSKVHSLYELGTSHRLWTFLSDASGKRFASFSEFCVTPKPHGLGANEATIRAALEDYLGKRGAQLETVPEPQPGPGRGHIQQEKKGDDCPSFSDRTAKALRAINRAPDAVKEAYREGLISQTLAAKLGPKNPPPERAAQIASIAQDVRKAKTRKEADAAVKRGLDMHEPSIVDRAFALVRKMTARELQDFESLLNTMERPS